MGALYRKESDGNGSTRGKRSRRPEKVSLDGVRDDIKEKGFSVGESVYDRRISSYVDSHVQVEEEHTGVTVSVCIRFECVIRSG